MLAGMLAMLSACLSAGCANPVMVRELGAAPPGDYYEADRLAAAHRRVVESTGSEVELSAAVEDYNAALTSLLVQPEGRTALEREGVWDGSGAKSGNDFDRVLLAERWSITGLRHRHRRPGIGVALVGFRENDNTAPMDQFLPPEGISRPVSAIAALDARGMLTIELHDPTSVDFVTIDGRALPLAADFTAPYAYLLARTEFARTRLTATLDASVYDERTGVYLLEDYSPAKIPVLMVHGLLSSPLTWRELTNDIFGDGALRSRYQVWHYVYPTGIPFLHGAATFREELGRTLAFLDPEGDDCASQNLVVVAHSKGGLFAKTLVADSDSRLWDTAFTVGPEQLESDPADVARLRRVLFFEHDRRVRRVVFIAVPHRGSAQADNPLARLAAAKIQLPAAEADAFERVLTQNQDVLQPQMGARLQTGLPSGPAALSSRDPFITTLAELNVHQDIPFHTVVGEVAEGRSTDGIVTHASAYQAGAESELVVAEAGHGVHAHKATVREVKRILEAHGDLPRHRSCPATLDVGGHS